MVNYFHKISRHASKSFSKSIKPIKLVPRGQLRIWLENGGGFVLQHLEANLMPIGFGSHDKKVLFSAK